MEVRRTTRAPRAPARGPQAALAEPRTDGRAALMPLRPCIRCGALTSGSYCPEHVPDRGGATRETPGRGSGSRRAAFRERVGEAAGWRCQAIVNGARCPVTDRSQLEAHHVEPVRGTGVDGRGVLLC